MSPQSKKGSDLDRVNQIGIDKPPPKEAYKQLQQAVNLSILTTLGVWSLGKLGEQPLKWMLRGFMIEFGLVWYG